MNDKFVLQTVKNQKNNLDDLRKSLFEYDNFEMSQSESNNQKAEKLKNLLNDIIPLDPNLFENESPKKSTDKSSIPGKKDSNRTEVKNPSQAQSSAQQLLREFIDHLSIGKHRPEPTPEFEYLPM